MTESEQNFLSIELNRPSDVSPDAPISPPLNNYFNDDFLPFIHHPDFCLSKLPANWSDV